MRLCGPQNRYGRCGEENKSIAPAGNWTPAVQPVARRYAGLSYPGFPLNPNKFLISHIYRQHGDLISLLSSSWERSWLKNTHVSEEHRICGMRWHESWWNMRWRCILQVLAGAQISFSTTLQYIYYINVISLPHALLGSTDLHTRYYYQHFKLQGTDN
jgi:hypothetical protein